MSNNINTYEGANTFLPPSPVTPMFLNIENITNSNRMVVTVSTPNSFVVNQVAYFSIPFYYGMFQLNSLSAEVIDVDPTNLILTFALDSSQFDAFVVPSGDVAMPATLSPAGSRNLYNFVQVPFHSVGNFGN